jgi:hypothetical protein
MPGTSLSINEVVLSCLFLLFVAMIHLREKITSKKSHVYWELLGSHVYWELLGSAVV